MERARLRRELGLIEATAIGVGTVIGTGIVKLPGLAAGKLGPAQVLAWILAAVLCALVALCFAELGARFPKSGGPFIFAREAFGEFPGFLVGWAFWAALSMAIGALALATADSIRRALHVAVPDIPLALLVLLLVTVINILGVKLAGLTQDVLTALKVALLLAFIVCGLPKVSWGNLKPFAPYGYSELGAATVLVLWAYLGFEEITCPGEEIKRPERNIPLAVLSTIVIATIVYILVAIVATGVLGYEALAKAGKGGVEEAARAIWGDLGGRIFSAFLVFSFICVMNGVLLANSRVLYAFAEAGILPEEITAVHPRFGTPHLAVVSQAIVAALAIALLKTFESVVIVVDFMMLVPYIFVTTAALALRKWQGAGSFKVPGLGVIAVIAAILSAYLMGQVKLAQMAGGTIAILCGVPVYIIGKKLAGKPASE